MLISAPLRFSGMVLLEIMNCMLYLLKIELYHSFFCLSDWYRKAHRSYALNRSGAQGITLSID